MYRVVLIDDEAIILEGLKKVVDWAGFGCEVVATAGDAASGMAMIREHKPDIFFTDIRMPDMDGLTMIAALKSEFPDMQVAVLTGYADFEYAQQAIRLGVTRFLLKPSRMDEINEGLRAMIANLERLSTLRQAEGDASPDIEEEQGAGSFIVRNAVAYIEENCAGRLTLQDVAEHCYVSQWHLSRLLNKHAGKNFYDILNEMRIAEAKRLLRDPGLKIGDIGDVVGYSDAGHFARVFKRLEGMSANEYRNRMKP